MVIGVARYVPVSADAEPYRVATSADQVQRSRQCFVLGSTIGLQAEDYRAPLAFLLGPDVAHEPAEGQRVPLLIEAWISSLSFVVAVMFSPFVFYAQRTLRRFDPNGLSYSDRRGGWSSASQYATPKFAHSNPEGSGRGLFA